MTEQRLSKWSADVDARSAASLRVARGATAWTCILPFLFATVCSIARVECSVKVGPRERGKELLAVAMALSRTSEGLGEKKR
jgi:hypothetical protein